MNMIEIMSDLFAELRGLRGRTVKAEAGDILFRRQDRIGHLHLVEKGSAQLVRYSETGGVIVMQRAETGTILAEASIFNERYHCDGIAGAELATWRIPMPALRQQLDQSPDLARTLAAYLAREVQRQRIRSEILSIRTVRDRLDAWLAFNGEKLPPRGSWKAIAEDIGVSPEAFYRELAQR
jgi:CRP/FNR family transcriptional regulator, dissimilatory nitrate respiration regulator